jgi:CheY-like chemotaxis protein
MANLLLCEDNDPLRLAMRTLLEGRGYRCTEACTGREAIAAMRRDSFDGLVVDLILPEVRGAEVIAWTRASFPKLPILAITGRQERYGNEALRAGAAHVLYKPFVPREFLEILEATLTGVRENAPSEPIRFTA